MGRRGENRVMNLLGRIFSSLVEVPGSVIGCLVYCSIWCVLCFFNHLPDCGFGGGGLFVSFFPLISLSFVIS